MTADPQGFLSPSDIAELAGVRRTVVSNWRRRHSDFPVAIAGTDANPLFARDEVVGWLTRRGHKVREPTAGGWLWEAANSIRGVASLDTVRELIPALACIKSRSAGSSSDAAWRSIVDGRQPELRERVTTSIAELGIPVESDVMRQLNVRDEELPVVVGALAHAIDRIPTAHLAEAVDFVLGRFARWQVKAGAEFGFIGSRTSALLVSLADTATGVVYDPACGIGNVLMGLADRGAHAKLVGHDIDAAALGVAAQRALLRDIEIELVRGDVLARDLDAALEADVVVAEPPFGLRWDPSSAIAEARFAYGMAPRSSADLAWVEHAIAHLAPDGRAYVLTASGALHRQGVERQIRSYLLSAGCLEAIVGLPAKMLPHTSIPLALWVLKRPGDATDVLLLDASETADVETRVAGWLAAHAEIEAPHALVALTDLLAADAVLTPARWIGRLEVDRDAIVAAFTGGFALIAEGVCALGTQQTDMEGLSDLPTSRIATIRELVDAGALELRPGRPVGRSEDRTPELEARLVKASDVKSRILARVADLPELGGVELTEPGDVLLTTMNEVCAVVDEAGGHVQSTGVERIRVRDTSAIAPGYLAAVLTGTWNSRFQTGTTIQRVHVRELEIPLIPLEDQGVVERAQAEIERFRQLSEQMAGQAEQVRNAILDALRYNVALEQPDVSQQSDRRHHAGEVSEGT
ncbi:MAG TPA: N-6 DNA methylase [Solirubrobacteraceae bacterium]|jgi:predicted RNA methylase|nr:N-6 DNA methylase [Solirubrobacteraceae bacterium]